MTKDEQMMVATEGFVTEDGQIYRAGDTRASASLRYRSRARGPFVRPHLLARTQVGSICVHFRPSIVCTAAEWLYSLAMRSSMATRGPKQHSAKLLSVGLLK